MADDGDMLHLLRRPPSLLDPIKSFLHL